MNLKRSEVWSNPPQDENNSPALGQQPSMKKPSAFIKIESENFVLRKVGSFDSDYEILDKLGEGAFGTVYKVLHKALQMQRALKIVNKKQSQILNKKLDQVEILKKLDHSNILKIYEFYEAKEAYFIITQLFDGKELFDEIVEEGKLDEETAINIVHEIVVALNYAHNQGIAHRDIKAENILVKKTSQKKYKVKIIDWGLSILIDKVKFGSFCGTPEYAPPESFMGIFTSSGDMWSLGILTYIMLTGQVPFRGKNSEETVVLIRKGIFDVKKEVFSRLSVNARVFILDLIQKSTKKRLTAQKAIEHDWLKKSKSHAQPPQLKESLFYLHNLNITNQLTIATLNFLNNHLASTQEKEKLSEVFAYLDKNGNGVLEINELIEGYSQLYGEVVGRKMAQQTFLKLDINKSMKLEYSEVIGFGVKRRLQQEKNKLWQAFKVFDKDRDGKISFDEVSSMLIGGVHNKFSEDQLKDILSEYDINHDEEIDFDEFVKTMMAISEKKSKSRKSEEVEQPRKVQEQQLEQLQGKHLEKSEQKFQKNLDQKSE